MNAYRSNKDQTFAKYYQWIGILVVCLLSVPLHFVYEWTGENTFAGLFTPLNESIWEHLKLVYWPLLIWWIVGYLIYRNKKDLSLSRWLTAAAVSILISMTFIVSWYYVWTEAFDIHSSILDVGSLFVAVPISQLVAIHVYKFIQPRRVYLLLSALMLTALAVLFFWFTFYSPDMPLFIPPSG